MCVASCIICDVCSPIIKDQGSNRKNQKGFCDIIFGLTFLHFTISRAEETPARDREPPVKAPPTKGGPPGLPTQDGPPAKAPPPGLPTGGALIGVAPAKLSP